MTSAGVASQRLLIVGNPELVHVGAHLFNAARTTGLTVDLRDTNAAYAGAWPASKFNWWFRGRRPSCLKKFRQEIVDACRGFRPRWLIATGISPIDARAMEEIGELGIRR